ncbi:MAG: NAD(P)/FAD-dependent oxidoreductase, partial [Candidatus Saccharimonadales bacterium]
IYDSLVLCLGQVTNYFGIPGLSELSYGVKSIKEVEEFKAHLHAQLLSDHKPDLNYIIVGAGPTGVELAGALQSYLWRITYLHGIERRPIHIDIVEAAPRVLPRLPKDMSRAVKRQLRRQGIRVFLNKSVEGENANALMVSGKPIQSHTVIWTAGTANNPFFADNGFTITPNHKVATDIYLQAEPDIYVLGDNANTPYSGMAQTAIVDAIFVSENLKRKARGKKNKSYVAKAPITVIPVREGWAGIAWGNARIYGWFGWLLRQAADARAFHNFEPWSKALPQWFSYSSTDPEQCAICNKQLS